MTATIPGVGSGRSVAFFVQNGSSSVSQNAVLTNSSGVATWTTTATDSWRPSVSIRARDEITQAVSSWQDVTVSSVVELITPINGSSINPASIQFSWNCLFVADSFDLIVDDSRDLSSPEVSKNQIEDLKGYTNTSYTLNDARGWLSSGTWNWKVIAYKNGAEYPSSPGSFTFIPSQTTQAVWGPILRAYHPSDHDHFYCTQQKQKQAAIQKDYRAEKPQGFIIVLPFSNSALTPVPLYRLYFDPGNVSNTARCHLYTLENAEKDACISHGWTYEGIIGFASNNYLPGLIPLYHLYRTVGDTTLRDHFYTTNEFERANAKSQWGFADKGILCWVSPTGDNSTLPFSLNGPSVGSGIDPFNGNLSHFETSSFSIPEGRMSLDFSHQYNSISVLLNTPIRSLGYGWSHTYSSCLTVDGGAIRVYKPGGGFYEYDRSTCARKKNITYDSLTRLSDTLYELKTKNQIVYRYAMLHKADSLAVLSSIRDRNSNTIQCNYTIDGNLTTVTGPKGRRLKFTYCTGQDSAFLIKSVTDTAGRSIQFAYDTAGRLISYINAEGNTTHYGYDTQKPFEHLLDTIKTPEGNTIVNEYSSDLDDKSIRRLVSQTTSKSGVVSNIATLDYSNSSFTKVLDARGKEFDFYYKQQQDGILNELVTPAGNATYEYKDSIRNPLLPTKIADGMGYITDVSYDERGNALKVKKPYSIEYNFDYTSFNDLSNSIGPLKDTTSYTYDAKGNLTTIKTYRGSTRIAYRSDGLVDSVINPLGYRTKLRYNQFGNVDTVTGPLNLSWRYTYDDISRLTAVYTPDGKVSGTRYLATDQIASTIGPIKDTTKYQYDKNGKLTAIENAKHFSTVLRYNAQELLDSITNPLNQTVSFSYTNNLLTKKTFASNDTLGISYDDAGRIISYSGVLTAAFEYDDNNNIKKITEGSLSMTFGYDSLNRLLQYTDYNGNTIKYSWDKAGNLDSLTYPGGKIVKYKYYKDNLLNTVTDWLGNTTTYYYRNDGTINYFTYPNGIRCFYTYDNAGRITGLANTKSNGDTINSYSFTLDSVGNITGEKRTEPLNAPKLTAENTTYTYDEAVNRILTAGPVSYSHDTDGNITGHTGGGPTFTYNFKNVNRLQSIDSASTEIAAYSYDVYGNRLSATRNGKNVRYILDISGKMSNILVETDNSFNPQYYYIYGLGMIYRIDKSNTPQYYIHDLRGSTIAMASASQAITHKYAYGTYGEVLADSGADDNQFKFVGKYGVMDEGNNIYFMRARYYDAKIGRFLSEDPIWTTNLYEYAGGNPLINMDYLGLSYKDVDQVPEIISMPNSATRKNISHVTGQLRSLSPLETTYSETFNSTPMTIEQNLYFIDEAGKTWIKMPDWQNKYHQTESIKTTKYCRLDNMGGSSEEIIRNDNGAIIPEGTTLGGSYNYYHPHTFSTEKNPLNIIISWYKHYKYDM